MAEAAKKEVIGEAEVRQDLWSGLRQDMEAFIDAIEFEDELWTRPLLRGFTVFPGAGGMLLKPFGSLLSKDDLAAGWREPFLHYELDEERLAVTVELPGIEKEAVQLDVGPDHIRLQAKGKDRSYRAFLETGVLDPGRAKAVYKDGVLRIIVPIAAEPATRIRHIKVH